MLDYKVFIFFDIIFKKVKRKYMLSMRSDKDLKGKLKDYKRRIIKNILVMIILGVTFQLRAT